MTGVARGFWPKDGAEAGRALVPIALLVVSAVLPDPGWVRWLVVVAVFLGTGIGVARAVPVRWAWAAALPAAVSLAWGRLPSGMDAGPTCIDGGAPLLVHELIRLVLVVGVILVLAMLLGADRGSLAIRLPARRYRWWAVAGLAVGFVAMVVVGAVLGVGTPPASLDAVLPAIGAAIAFGVGRGIADTLVWRGALLGWGGRVVGTGLALLAQAAIVGLALLPVGPFALIAGVAALALGAIVVRTRSLLVAGAVDIGIGIAVFFFLAC